MSISKQMLENLLPPIAIRAGLRLFNKAIIFEGDYDNWQQAASRVAGYANVDILNKVKEATLKVKKGEAKFERDSFLSDKIEYSWPLLTALLKIYIERDNKLNVLDFGGALGSSYFQNRNFLKDLKNMRWAVVEQHNFVKCGQEYFQDNQLKFYYSIKECLENEKIDVVLLSSVLPYVENPYGILQQISEQNITYLVIDRTPFIAADRDRLTIQNVPPSIYPARYPAWFFAKEKFLRTMEKFGYQSLAEFEALDKRKNIPCQYLGYIFAKARLEGI